MAAVGVSGAKNLSTRVRTERRAKKSRSPAPSAAFAGRISAPPGLGARLFWVRSTDPACGRIAESVKQI